jgi:HKD family nuclease
VFDYEVIIQTPDRPDQVLRGIERLAAAQSFNRLRGAFAYATASGALELLDALALSAAAWAEVQKRWLISIDYGFSEPRALRMLGELPNSELRVPAGAEVLQARLKPANTQHAKLMLLERTGGSDVRGPFAALIGSANLTTSALHDNFEAVSISRWSGNLSARARDSLEATTEEAERFDEVWDAATEVDGDFLARYEKAWRSARQRKLAPEQEQRDSIKRVSEMRAAKLEFAAALRAAPKLWIETGNMYANLGGAGGNQLDMKRGTRTFFGFANRQPEDSETAIGTIDLEYEGNNTVERNLRYGQNSMDKLDLPVPGTGGAPNGYANETLLFERREDGSFGFKVGTETEVADWRRLSKAQGSEFKMQGSSRRFGVFFD